MDFVAYPKKIFMLNWNWPNDHIRFKSDINTSYYTVEIAISLESLIKFNLLNDNKIETGIFRAKYNKMSHLNYEPTWISWINPNTETPNFHTPTSFGILTLMDYE